MVLIMGRNIHFKAVIWKIVHKLSCLHLLIWNTGICPQYWFPVQKESISLTFYLQDDKPDGPIGPLRLAAMNGLAMSRPMVLALMNDETRAPKDERVSNTQIYYLP